MRNRSYSITIPPAEEEVVEEVVVVVREEVEDKGDNDDDDEEEEEEEDAEDEFQDEDQEEEVEQDEEVEEEEEDDDEEGEEEEEMSDEDGHHDVKDSSTFEGATASKMLPVRASRPHGSMLVHGVYVPHKRPRRCVPLLDPTPDDSDADDSDAEDISSSSPLLSRRDRAKQRHHQKYDVLKSGQAKLFKAIHGCGNRNWKALVEIAAPNSEVEKNATGLMHHAMVVHAYVMKLIKNNGHDDSVKSVAQEVAEETGCGVWQVTRWHRDFFRLIAAPSQPPAPNISASITAVPIAPAPTTSTPGIGAMRDVHGGEDAAATTPEGGVPLAGSKAVYTWSDGTGRLEVVTILQVHSQSEGEAITIFVPSIACEKQTVIERLDFRQQAIGDCLRVAQAATITPLSPPSPAAPDSPPSDSAAPTVGSLLSSDAVAGTPCDGAATDTPVAFMQGLLRHACTILLSHTLLKYRSPCSK